MKLVIFHYHLQPGGIRRIIELATPHLVRTAARPITRVVLATGRHPDVLWHHHFIQQLPGVPVAVWVEPSFDYLSEQHEPPDRITTRIRQALQKLFAEADAGNCLVWAHNLGVGRNLLLARELAAACAERGIRFVAHHHDWWFDNRWARWHEMRQVGFPNLAALAQAVFPQRGNTLHVAINHADAAILSRHLGQRVLWLPNLTEPAPPPTAARVRFTHRWLRNRLARDGAPMWLLPCRTLRRKNIAEALLLTRWLRPEAWLVVTGAASSADEVPYFRALERAAHQHHWRMRLGVLAGDESRKPNVRELLAASEAVLLTSVQEGFGLPYLEAAAARRPLIARRLPNVAPDLHRFGFRFSQAYHEILIAPELFDWNAELGRQKQLFRAWRATMPAFARARVSRPPMLTTQRPFAIAFSRLTLTAQLEVLARPARETWAACLPLNPFLETWRQRAAAGNLRVTPWPRTANRWLGGAAYARRLFTALALTQPAATVPLHRSSRRGEALTSCWGNGQSLLSTAATRFMEGGEPRGAPFSPLRIQSDFITAKLDARDLYPLLWSKDP